MFRQCQSSKTCLDVTTVDNRCGAAGEMTRTAMSVTLVLQEAVGLPFRRGRRSQALNLNDGHDSVVTTQMANLTVHGNGSVDVSTVPRPLDTHVIRPSCPITIIQIHRKFVSNEIFDFSLIILPSGNINGYFDQEYSDSLDFGAALTSVERSR